MSAGSADPKEQFMALMRAKHNVLNVVAEVPDNDYYRDNGWSKVSDDTPTTFEAEREAEARKFLGIVAYDPAEHTVEEVLAYLADAEEGERTRVLQAERDGKARVTILGTD